MEKNEKEMELRSDEVQDVMTEISPAIVRWGNTVIFILVLFLIVGSYIFKYPDTITASVVVTTQEPPASIIARATGKIDEIFVKNNQPVSVGATLGVIQNPANTADVLLLRHRLEKWKTQKQDLQVAKSLFDDQPLQLGSVQSSYATFLRLLREYVDFNERRYYQQKINLQDVLIQNQKDNLLETTRQSQLVKQQLETALSTFRRDSLLYQKGVVSEEGYDAAKNKILQSRQSFSLLRSSIKQSEMVITQSRGTMLDLQQQLKENENNFAVGLQIATEQLTSDIKAWERTYLLVSPIQGTVNLMGVWSNNQNVNSGETIFTILPTLQMSPIGKALMPVQGSGKVKVGQRAHIRLHNFPDQEFGFLDGFVQNISSTPNSKGKYVVEIRLPNGLTTNYKKKLPITRQMEGSAEIITEDIRLIERFFNPIRKLLKERT